jgi:hypothetical protein
MKRIHIIGMSPRTGTTLLAECMSACFDIDASEEHEAEVTELRRNVNVYLTKSPGDIMAVDARLRFDPHFYVICMMRDPRDVVVSRHGKLPDRYWAPLRLWKGRLPALRKLMRYPRFLLVRYEDLVSDPDSVQAKIQEHIPFLKRKAPFSAFHKVASPSQASLQALNDVRAITTSSTGRWREHLPRIAGQLQQHGSITNELIEFGYEKDASWLKLVEGVAPDLTPSATTEHAATFVGHRPWRRPIAKGYISAAKVFAARAFGIKVT